MMEEGICTGSHEKQCTGRNMKVGWVFDDSRCLTQHY